MRTDTAYKLSLIKSALKAGQEPKIQIDGHHSRYTITAIVKDKRHSIVLRCAAGGIMVIDPDVIAVVWLSVLPKVTDVDAN